MGANTYRLQPAQLYRSTNLSDIGFTTTDDLADLDEVVGQPRAVDAIRFGTGIRSTGFNIYAAGPEGLDKRDLVRLHFEAQARSESTPSDWCYVHNLVEEHRPVAIALPAGSGAVFRRDMEALVQEARAALSAAFDSEEYQSRRQSVNEEFRDRQSDAFELLQQRARGEGLALIRTPGGVAVAPVREGEVLSPDEIQKLPEETQKALQEKVEALQKELERILGQMPGWQREMRDQLNELSREMANLAVGVLIDELRRKYADHTKVVAHLDAVRNDIVQNAELFLPQPEGGAPEVLGVMQRQSPGQFFLRYGVNVLVDRSGAEGAPVIYEDNPTYANMIGRIEHRAQMGALVTDFTLIKAGALHRANGGYLMVDAAKLLMQPQAWEGLKRALLSQQIAVEPLGQHLGLISTVSLEPERIPLQVRVALIGDSRLYYLLWSMDPEFAELFKVMADFGDVIPRDTETQRLYARLIATLARQEKLLPFDRSAVERLLEHGARISGDSGKLSAQTQELKDLMLEAEHWARQSDHRAVTSADVQRAIDSWIFRMDRVRERVQEAILRGTVVIDTNGSEVGQINGLSVAMLGNFAFGQPARITARINAGKGKVVDIEREVDLGGPLHSKGVLILTGFLSGRYAAEAPLSLSASLVFEQSYGGIDGDSASSAELYALLSAISGVPIKQSLAVTGSVSQKGEVQAIGGVNEKIEGFFDICRARGLTGDQGVLIPASNVINLMLRQDVVEAVAAERFHIYAVGHVDQGIEILTGLPAGEPDAEGAYAEGTINQKVQARLKTLAGEPRADKAAGEEKGE
ncbi:MAG: AAA family ATPase [Anaerolineae bacterium]|nr:AAA family ATPase [Anaerolineae bacterium]